MNKMKVLVVGASGFIGLPLVTKLSASGHEVMAISRRCTSNSLETNTTCWVHSDLSLSDTYKKEVKDFRPNVVIYLSWQDLPDFSFDKSLLNLNQSLEFLNFILELGSCNKIVVSGSCLEYDITKGECKENNIGKPKDNFTWAKHSLFSWLEIMCKKKNVQLAWLRIFYVYGPRQRIDSLIPSILEHLQKGELPDLRTPNNANDFIYIDDVVDAFIKAITKEYKSGIFNIGSSKSTSVLEICRVAEQIVLGQNVLTKQLESNIENISSDVDFWAAIDQAHGSLGWQPKTSVINGIKKTQNWLQNK